VRARLAKLAPASLDDEQRAVYDQIAGGPRAGGPFRLVDAAGALEGPFNAFLLQPRLGQSLQALGAAVRYGTGLTDRAREIAILVVAAAEDSAFERYAHEAVGRRAGLTDDELTAIREGKPGALTDHAERLVAVTTRALLERGDLDDDEYGAAAAGLGLPGLFEVLTLVGYYKTLALQLRVFRVGLPDE
jgi:4-carboxymuconolactone decarboxylase